MVSRFYYYMIVFMLLVCKMASAQVDTASKSSLKHEKGIVLSLDVLGNNWLHSESLDKLFNHNTTNYLETGFFSNGTYALSVLPPFLPSIGIYTKDKKGNIHSIEAFLFATAGREIKDYNWLFTVKRYNCQGVRYTWEPSFLTIHFNKKGYTTGNADARTLNFTELLTDNAGIAFTCDAGYTQFNIDGVYVATQAVRSCDYDVSSGFGLFKIKPWISLNQKRSCLHISASFNLFIVDWEYYHFESYRYSWGYPGDTSYSSRKGVYLNFPGIKNHLLWYNTLNINYRYKF
jgi:hypothetical protein